MCISVKHSCAKRASLDKCLHLLRFAVSKSFIDAGQRRGTRCSRLLQIVAGLVKIAAEPASQGRRNLFNHAMAWCQFYCDIAVPFCTSAEAVSTTWFG